MTKTSAMMVNPRRSYALMSLAFLSATKLAMRRVLANRDASSALLDFFLINAANICLLYPVALEGAARAARLLTQFFFEQHVHHLGIRLALGRLHHLANKEANHPFLACLV